MKKLAWITVPLMTLALTGCGGKKSSGGGDAKSAEQTVTATPQEMVKAYAANTVAADQKFKDKRIKVTGVVKDINTGITGAPYVIMSTGYKYGLYDPHFNFSKDHLNELAKVQKGKSITVICTGHGDIAKTPMNEDCELSK
ncbi:MAG: hypothetical protein KIG68_03725 [Oxalobacter sp.]|nr:hypothetical protein [Oxalobacter sp.]